MAYLLEHPTINNAFYAGLNHKNKPTWAGYTDGMVCGAIVFITEASLEAVQWELQSLIDQPLRTFDLK